MFVPLKKSLVCFRFGCTPLFSCVLLLFLVGLLQGGIFSGCAGDMVLVDDLEGVLFRLIYPVSEKLCQID